MAGGRAEGNPSQISLALACKHGSPPIGHVSHGPRSGACSSTQRVLETAVDDALALNGLAAAQGLTLDQADRIAACVQPVQEHQAGDASANDEDIVGWCG